MKFDALGLFADLPEPQEDENVSISSCGNVEGEESNNNIATEYLCAIIVKTPVRIILWCSTTKMLIKACFLIQQLEQEGGCQKCCVYK